MISLILLLSTSVFAETTCPDLSGYFVPLRTRMIFTISQKACEEISFTDSDGTETRITDGVFRSVRDSRGRTNSGSAEYKNESLVLKTTFAEVPERKMSVESHFSFPEPSHSYLQVENSYFDGNGKLVFTGMQHWVRVKKTH